MRGQNQTPQKLSSHRRTFLKAVGAGFAALPFFKGLEDSFAQSMGEELPLKFLGVYHPHGVCAEYWVMQSSDTETSFNLTFESCSLEPLEPFKDKLLLLEGIDLLSNANGHDSAGTILTGSRIAEGKPQNSSLDQFLAVEQGLGGSNRVTSIALAVGTDNLVAGETLSYGPGGEPLSKIIDPMEAFDLLFEGLVVGDDPEAQAEAERRRRLGQSVLDYVREDVNRLKTRLGPQEQLKLDQHLTSLRELEKQLKGATGMGATCVVPQRPDAAAFPKLRRYNGGEPYFDAITDAHIDLLAQAFACDVTRFGTLFLNDLSYAGNPLNLPEDNHGAVAHAYKASPIGENGRPVQGDTNTWPALASFNRYSYGKIARLIQRLQEFGALDSTLIYATSDMGNPALHSTRNVPTLLAGGANGLFRMGRRLKMIADCPEESPWCGENDEVFRGSPSNHILVSIAQAFGVEIESYGTQPDPASTTGPLSELT